MPGSSATYPMLDMVSQRIYDRGTPSKGEALMKVRPMRPIAPATALALNNEMTGGSINWDQVKNVSTPYLKQGVSMGLNIAVPTLSKAIGEFIAGPEGKMIGAVVGELARDLIKTKTGLARQKNGGKISLSKLKKKTKPYVSAGLDAVVPGVGGLLGSVVEPGGGTVVGTLAGQLAREGIRQTTGYGRKSKDVGVYKGGAKAKPRAKPKPKANS